MLLSPCAEGALGYVIQLQPVSGEEGKPQALKIPRLRADTVEENASIAAILSNEADRVFFALRKGRQGLVSAPNDKKDLLQGPRSLIKHADATAREQNGCIPLISFGKDHRVRVCNVRFDQDPKDASKMQRKVFPPSAEPYLAFLTFEHWKPYLSTNQTQKDFAESVVFRNLTSAGDSGANPTIDLSLRAHHPLADALTDPDRKGKEAWFAGLPSIQFDWAHGTLQHAISNGRHAKWTFWDQCVLLQEILKGLRVLHRRGVVHADIRPANILSAEAHGKEYANEELLALPNSYRLSDYGSFANDRQTAGAGQGNTGHTSMPGIARHRASIFYGRERRAGVEREDANLAVLIPVPAQKDSSKYQYFVRLGWKGQLTVPGSNDLHPLLIDDMRQAALELAKSDGAADSSKEDWNLKPFDQFRIRDLVFIIDQHRAWRRPLAAVDEGRGLTGAESQIRCLDFLCKPNYTRVLLEKIGVSVDKQLARRKEEADSRLPEYLLFDLPRWIEIRQTSFASDIYSIGVLALYLVYTAQKMNADQPASTDSWNEENVEESLLAILHRFEDPSNFNHLFPQLDYVCRKIEEYVDESRPAAELLNEKPQAHEPPQSERKTTLSTETLGGTPWLFKVVVKNLIETTIYLSTDLKVVSSYFGNHGHFLLFLHFVLSCLHRRSNLNASNVGKLVRKEFPFCQHRCDSSENLVDNVIKRLEKLQGYESHKRFFKDFHAPFDTDEEKKPQEILSDYELRQVFREEKERRSRLEVTIEQLKHQLETMERSRLRLAGAVRDVIELKRGVLGITSIPEKTIQLLRSMVEDVKQGG